MNNYREYEKPIAVEWVDPILGHGKGMALGVKETTVDDKISLFYFLVLPEGKQDPVLIWQKYILPDKTKNSYDFRQSGS